MFSVQKVKSLVPISKLGSENDKNKHEARNGLDPIEGTSSVKHETVIFRGEI